MQTKYKVILAILISFTSELNIYSDIMLRNVNDTLQTFSGELYFYSDIILRNVNDTLQTFSGDIITTPELKIYKTNETLPAKNIKLETLENVFNECKKIVFNSNKSSQEVKKKIQSCKIIIEKSDFKYPISVTTITFHPVDAVDVSKYAAVDAIQINVFLIAKLNLDERNDFLTLKTLILHELGHIVFNDLETIEAQKKELQDKDSETLLALINTDCIEHGFNPNWINHHIEKEAFSESKENLITLIHNLQFRHNERRADLFAATMLEKNEAMDGFERFSKIYSDILPKYEELNGSLKDDHDPDNLRLKLLNLHSNGEIKLNLGSGEIEDARKNKVLSPKETKAMLESSDQESFKTKNKKDHPLAKPEEAFNEAETPNEKIDQMVAKQES